jgi:hypothetical protein
MKSRVILFLLLMVSFYSTAQKVDPQLLAPSQNVQTWRTKLNANAVRFNDSIYNLYQKIIALQQQIATLNPGGGGVIPQLFLATGGYDSTYTLATSQKYAIPEDVANGDVVGTWFKTYTWRSGASVSFEINTNHNNAFSINSTTGEITISDAAKIKGKINRQDTTINLIIRSIDEIFGYELDTAYIRVKEHTYCKFIDYSWSGTELGYRETPYNTLADLTQTLQSGYGYFIKRGNTPTNVSNHILNGITNSALHPLIIGAYGSGPNPEFNGIGLTTDDAAIYFRNSSTPNSTTQLDMSYCYLYNIDVKNYPEQAFRILNGCNHMGFYNMKFTNNQLVGWNGGLADIYFYGSISDTTLAQRKFMEIINVESSGSWGPIIKCEVAGVYVTNVKSATHGNPEMSMNLRIGTTYSWVRHFWLIGGDRSFQMRMANCSATDGIIEGATSYGNHTQYDASVTPPATAYGNVFNNILFRRCDDGMYLYDGQTNWTIKNCMFDRNNRGIVYFKGGSGHIIERTTFKNNVVTGIYFENGGATPVNLQNSIIRYCTFKGTNPLTWGTSATENLKIYNCTVDGPIAISGTGAIVRNCFYKTTLSGATASNNINIDNITTGDYFHNYSTGDFRLKGTATSAIDKGYFLSISPDMVGTTVPQSSITDIGAFEYKLL